MPSPAAARLHLQPTDRCPTFDLLLRSIVGSIATITTIGGAVAAAIFAAASRFCRRLGAPECRCCCCRALSGSPQLVQAATKVAQAAQQRAVRGGYLQAAQAGRLRAFRRLWRRRAARRLRRSAMRAAWKKVLASQRVFSRCTSS